MSCLGFCAAFCGTMLTNAKTNLGNYISLYTSVLPQSTVSSHSFHDLRESFPMHAGINSHTRVVR